ncbi:1-acyl-sn-glycerol-3-phosphate acyltransferase [Thioclava sp. FR2]|uniref:1-acyl-sn-glycerol-3-phosphate acyltransferase n=1 Tax=Thioclava sp. FR2 TaxID=3445780 RepID=UPI003EC07BDF
MFNTVEIPVWLLLIAGLLAAIAALERIIGPGFRWLLRGRVERLVARVNARLDRKIEPFKLMSRHDWVVRLLYDPKVLEAVADHAAETGVTGEVALEEARRYAREIVPGFSALIYFGFAIKAARWLSAVFFRVRVGKVATELAAVDRSASVVLVMNHRSNMDYVLVTWLVSGRVAISYAVGEWARVWPLSALIRASGAYFIRRNSRTPLYRRVLARYVQMATSEGAVQAVFPEGGLSLDGRVGKAKLGLLSYIWSGWSPDGRDVVFVPVGLAYDRVLEDALLLRAAKTGERRFRPRLWKIVWDALRIAARRAGGRKYLYGTAGAGFGAPLSMRDWRLSGGDLEGFSTKLMADVEAAVPVLPVPLVAASLVLDCTIAELVGQLKDKGAVLKLPPGGLSQAENEGRAMLQLRGVLDSEGRPRAEMRDLLTFYAASIRQRLGYSMPNSAP